MEGNNTAVFLMRSLRLHTALLRSTNTATASHIDRALSINKPRHAVKPLARRVSVRPRRPRHARLNQLFLSTDVLHDGGGGGGDDSVGSFQPVVLPTNDCSIA